MLHSMRTINKENSNLFNYFIFCSEIIYFIICIILKEREVKRGRCNRKYIVKTPCQKQEIHRYRNSSYIETTVTSNTIIRLNGFE